MNNLVKFNITKYMYIQITDKGHQYLKETVGDEYIKHCITPYKVTIDNEIWYKLQCHQAFELLPIHLNTGKFMPNVMFDNKDLTPYKQ